MTEFTEGIRTGIRSGAKQYFIDTPLQALELLKETELPKAKVGGSMAAYTLGGFDVDKQYGTDVKIDTFLDAEGNPSTEMVTSSDGYAYYRTADNKVGRVPKGRM